MSLTLLWIITGLLLLIGLLGSIIPSMPGLPIIFAGILLYALFTDFSPVNATFVIITGAVTALMQVFDYLAGMWGVKKLGGTGWGVGGSLIGSILGFFFLGAFVGMFLGAFIGAFLGELLGAGQNLSSSVKIGLGSIIGLLAGTLVRIVVAIAMVAAFVFQVV